MSKVSTRFQIITGYVHDLWFYFLVPPIIFVMLYAFAGCLGRVVEPEDIVEPDDLVGIAEAYCDAHPEWPCGHVWLCTSPSTNPDNQYGRMEVCLLDDISVSVLEDLYGPCEPTPRHVGLCWVCCGTGCGVGGNAYDGTYCPAPPPPPPPDAGVFDGPIVHYPKDLP